MAFSVVVVLLQLLLCCCSCCCAVAAVVVLLLQLLIMTMLLLLFAVFFSVFFASHTTHLFPCLPKVGVARIFNLLIELPRAPFQRVWVQFMCILTPMPEREKKPFE